jgi:DNA-binding GntR family transcriptional regulator
MGILRESARSLTFSHLSEQIYVLLKSEILEGELVSGTQLSSSALARELGVSITPVRDALRQLDREGLVNVIPRRGTFVAGLSRKDVREIFQIRRILELAAAEELLSAPESFVQEMERIQQETEQLVTGNEFSDQDRYAALDMDFHQHLVDLLGNERVSQLHRELRWSVRVARILHAAHLQRASQTTAEHAAIVAAVKARKVACLSVAIRTHLDQSESNLLPCIAAADTGGPEGS